MGHAEHFLQRLNRVVPAHMELAMRLYNHPVLVDHILHWAMLERRWSAPPARLALALDAGASPPYIVLTGEGRFVTCLGAGMVVDDLEIIHHREVMACLKREERIVALRGEREDLGALFNRIFLDPDNFSREDYLTLVHWEPLMRERYALALLDTEAELELCNARLARLPAQQLRRRSAEELMFYWQLMGAEGIFLMLSLHDLGAFQVLLHSPEAALDLVWSVGRHGHLGMRLRGLWGMARLAPWLFDALEERLLASKVRMPRRANFELVGMVAMGLRHQRLYDRMVRLLNVLKGRSEDDRASFLGSLSAMHLYALDFVPAQKATIRTKVQLFMKKYGLMEEGSPWAELKPDELPDDLVVSCLASLVGEPHDNMSAAQAMHEGLFVVAKAAAEDFQPPQAQLAIKRHAPPSQRLIRELMINAAFIEGKPRPRHATATPGRNEPCPCGSGQKYKRCCGR